MTHKTLTRSLAQCDDSAAIPEVPAINPRGNLSVAAADQTNNDRPSARGVSGVSRRSLVMNTAVSVASLASATAVASPIETPKAPLPAEIDSSAAMIARAEQIVEVLGDRFVCDGWHEHFNQQRASAFLDAARRVDYSADDDPATAMVLAWSREHGQSLDWLFDGDPVGLICSAAARSPNALAILAGPDPVFGVIDRHRAACEALEAACHAHGEAEVRWREEGGQIGASVLFCTRKRWESVPHNDMPWPFGECEEVRFHSGRHIERFFAGSDETEYKQELRTDLAAVKRKRRSMLRPAQARMDAAFDVEAEARRQLATTAPTTGAGVLAVLRYAEEQHERTAGGFFQDDEQTKFYASLSRASAALMRASPNDTAWSDGVGVDARLFTLWGSYRPACAALRAATDEWKAASDKLPAWARPGSQFTDSDGTERGLKVGSPAIELDMEANADLWNYTPHIRMVRPSPAYIEQYHEFYRRDFGQAKADEWKRRIEARLNDALARRAAEEAKLNIPALNHAWEAASAEICRIEKEIEALAPATPNVIAAIMLIEVERGAAGALCVLAALRPLLTGMIGEEVAEFFSVEEEREAATVEEAFAAEAA
jgi:hypothetical protein